jgi:rSAM/selenodomain-associated transferase 2
MAEMAAAGMEPCELTVVVPTYNEEVALPALLACLAAQQGVHLEVLVSDGGSTDATCDLACRLAQTHGLRLRVVSGAKGRGAQLNHGAAASNGEYLLFLHADSRFTEVDALRQGLDLIATMRQQRPDRAVAGHYSLSFERSSTRAGQAYYFYESKARLDRAECTHGDQGLLLPRDVFARLGPFIAFPPMLAETRLADRVRELGALLLVPSPIITSARRFESEGLYQRQVLNAILMSCASQGWDEPFTALTALYRAQSDSGSMRLAPLLGKIRELIAKMPPAERRLFWRSTGSYVRRNAWQLAFLMDVRRSFRQGLDPGQVQPRILARFDRHWDRWTDNPAGRLAATILTWMWFALTRAHASFSR